MFPKLLSPKTLLLTVFSRPIRRFLRLHNPIKTEGSALITALILSVVIAMLAIVGAQLIATAYRDVRQQEHQGAEVDNVARAGLVDAISWFKRQATQPVSSGYPPTHPAWADGAFNPQFNTNAALSDTIDSSIGIVQEYPLNAATGLYGRYEVRRQTNPATAGVVYDSYSVHDITGQRFFNGEQTGQGYAWYIASRGYVYKASSNVYTCNGATSTFNIKNVLARSKVSTEIRRITLTLPNSCAVITNYGGTPAGKKNSPPAAPVIIVNNKGNIAGGSFGVGYSGGANPPFQINGGTITPSAAQSVIVTSCTPSYVLGVSTADLKIMANYLVNNVNQLPNPLPDMCLVYICGDAVFNSANPLFSSGILFVDGNLTLASGAYCNYQGLIYCTGTVTIQDSNVVQGCIIAWLGLVLSETGATETCTIQYSSTILSRVRQLVCQYREMKSTYRVFTGISDF